MKTIRVPANTSLARLALEHLGDARQWVRIAQTNRLFTPVTPDLMDLIIPARDRSAPKGLPK